MDIIRSYNTSGGISRLILFLILILVVMPLIGNSVVADFATPFIEINNKVGDVSEAHGFVVVLSSKVEDCRSFLVIVTTDTMEHVVIRATAEKNLVKESLLGRQVIIKAEVTDRQEDPKTKRIKVQLKIHSVKSPETKKAIPETSLFSREDLVEAAYATYLARRDATRGGTKDPTNEIYSTYWADGIKALNPVKVYTHRINIVVVQCISNETEEGKYIVIPISSYLPMTGDDGFVFSPEPLNGNTYTLGNGVFDFKRTRSK